MGGELSRLCLVLLFPIVFFIPCAHISHSPKSMNLRKCCVVFCSLYRSNKHNLQHALAHHQVVVSGCLGSVPIHKDFPRILGGVRKIPPATHTVLRVHGIPFNTQCENERVSPMWQSIHVRVGYIWNSSETATKDRLSYFWWGRQRTAGWLKWRRWSWQQRNGARISIYPG